MLPIEKSHPRLEGGMCVYYGTYLEATTGFEPVIRVLQTLAFIRSPSGARGGSCSGALKSVSVSL